MRPQGGARPIDPGVGAGVEPARTASGPASIDLLDATGCAVCHAAIAAEWAKSRHAVAWTNGIFQREYSARPLAWCVNCHAPLTTQQAGRFPERGVDCAGCHVRGGAIVSRQRRPGSPHQAVAEPSFGSPAFCADCHEFKFPILDAAGEVTRWTPHPMQTTVASFRAGPYARQPDGCLMCHGSRTNHAFPGGHDPAMLEAAVDVAWCRRTQAGPSGATGDTTSDAIEVSVGNSGAGHNVPTGDIHRHMNLRIWRSSAPESLFEAYYGRRFEPADDGGKRIVWDSTIAPETSRRHSIALASLGGDVDEPINLELIYVYLATERPRPGQAPDEPFTASMVRWRALPGELPTCP